MMHYVKIMLMVFVGVAIYNILKSKVSALSFLP